MAERKFKTGKEFVKNYNEIHLFRNNFHGMKYILPTTFLYNNSLYLKALNSCLSLTNNSEFIVVDNKGYFPYQSGKIHPSSLQNFWVVNPINVQVPYTESCPHFDVLFPENRICYDKLTQQEALRASDQQYRIQLVGRDERIETKAYYRMPKEWDVSYDYELQIWEGLQVHERFHIDKLSVDCGVHFRFGDAVSINRLEFKPSKNRYKKIFHTIICDSNLYIDTLDITNTNVPILFMGRAIEIKHFIGDPLKVCFEVPIDLHKIEGKWCINWYSAHTKNPLENKIVFVDESYPSKLADNLHALGAETVTRFQKGIDYYMFMDDPNLDNQQFIVRNRKLSNFDILYPQQLMLYKKVFL